MICLVKVGLFNGLRLAAKGDVIVQTLTLAIALVNVIDAAEHCSVGEYLVDVLDAGLGAVGAKVSTS